jgi:predicted N-acetyltransferase YhbS
MEDKSPRTYSERDICVLNPERPADHADVYALVQAAFGQPDEADLVARLRQSSGFVPDLSIVLHDWDHQLLGHVLFSRCKIVDDEGGETESLALAPLSVLPAHQRQGVGKGLVRHGLLVARELGFGSVVVLGDPAYYSRFGFQSAEDWAIHAPFPVPPGALQVLELQPAALAGVWGTVQYDPAFHQ